MINFKIYKLQMVIIKGYININTNNNHIIVKKSCKNFKKILISSKIIYPNIFKINNNIFKKKINYIEIKMNLFIT